MNAPTAAPLAFVREDVADAIVTYASQHKTSALYQRVAKSERVLKLANASLHNWGDNSVWQAIDALEESARPHYFALVAKLDGDAAAEELRTNYGRISDPAGVTVHVSNCGDDPFYVMFEIHDEIADAWADANGSLDGGTWECPDGDTSFVYDMGLWYPGLFDKLKAEGYKLDLSAWDDPDEDDLAVAKHWGECPKCDGQDFARAKEHLASLSVAS